MNKHILLTIKFIVGITNNYFMLTITFIVYYKEKTLKNGFIMVKNFLQKKKGEDLGAKCVGFRA